MKTQIEHLGFTINLVQDEHAESPNNWGDDSAFLVYDHRQFCVERKGFDPSDIFERFQNGGRLYDGYFMFPVYAYIHSGVSLSLGRNSYPFNGGFDTSFRGFCLIKRESGTWTSDKARKVAEGITETWNQYLSGDVYGYQVEDKDGTELDSCWGFYGSDHCLEEAKAICAYHLGEQFKKRIQAVKTFIRNRVPLHIRQSHLN